MTFSGGRDSSAVLATATMVARKHGLNDPVPITLRCPAIEEADETASQELVIRHLGIEEWLHRRRCGPSIRVASLRFRSLEAVR